MAIQVYNTLTRQKEVFRPIKEGQVAFYVCGPTVYNYIHIGNARSAVAFDTIRRYFQYRGYQVNYVSNFTDVDDKIIKAAIAEGSTPEAIADKYIAAFKEDTGQLNIQPATVHPRVMENIEEIIVFVQTLIEKGHAYESEGDVYFKTESFKDYGHLSDQSLEDLLVGASERLDQAVAERKANPLDFALWKTAKPGEIAWDSPWGPGRPGWHIECSVMATKYLGDTIDIHGGGQDLTFPHHENEIAQSEACTGHTFAHYWLHNGFVTIGKQDEKMSKSLGNFVLLRDLLAAYDPMVIRYMLATTHYRRPLRYDEAVITEAQANVNKLREAIRRLKHRQEQASADLEGHETWLAEINGIQEQFVTAMDDDFNASNGITALFDLVKSLNRYLDLELVSQAVLSLYDKVLHDLLAVFGLDLEDKSNSIDQEIEALIEERRQARANKDFARSDAIRDQLKEQGILLDDTPQGTVWKRVNR
ncbi:cysteine--tRNA ligase [Abiotrophia defectiva]|uniref:cysteine--tRNA ligase n=1 Tax=Abiotrophia defectiva TaxID=46125 RepID=UPI0022800251|nr:cysteine--tRNA ligase [Abiotrophia defectiva]MCY7225155.1 cysteine--tRNA ligase [Abiotrophia defectiva]